MCCFISKPGWNRKALWSFTWNLCSRYVLPQPITSCSSDNPHATSCVFFFFLTNSWLPKCSLGKLFGVRKHQRTNNQETINLMISPYFYHHPVPSKAKMWALTQYYWPPSLDCLQSTCTYNIYKYKVSRSNSCQRHKVHQSCPYCFQHIPLLPAVQCIATLGVT